MNHHPTHKVLQPIRVSKEKTLWQELGVVWESKDRTSLSVQLDSIPLSGRIIIKRIDESKEIEAF